MSALDFRQPSLIETLASRRQLVSDDIMFTKAAILRERIEPGVAASVLMGLDSIGTFTKTPERDERTFIADLVAARTPGGSRL